MTWKCPSPARLMQTVDATWPAAQYLQSGPFTLRRGDDGGKRVSSASLEGGSANTQQISVAESAMRDLGQPPLFMVRDGQQEFDKSLEALGYRSFDFVTLFASPTDALAGYDPHGMVAISAPEPMPIMAEIWLDGGIDEGRLNVMRRATGLKSCILGRHKDSPEAAAFVAIDGDIAMLHALEIRPASRRQGLAIQIMGAAAAWAQENGTQTFALAVVSQNTPACNLYRRLGMIEAGSYHYRIKENP